MTNEFRKKAVELGKLMNNKSKLSVPLEKMIMTIVEGFDRMEKKLDSMMRSKEQRRAEFCDVSKLVQSGSDDRMEMDGESDE